MKVPVVLPVVCVRIDAQDTLAVDIDGEAYRIDRTLGRDDLRQVLGEITTERQTAVRVEITEADGTTYVDILTPSDITDDTAGGATDETLPDASLTACVRGTGFRPGERVAVAYVLMHHVADEDGHAEVRLPPAILARHQTGLVLVGLDSSVIASLDATPLGATA